jgi:hypothetical protein
VEEEHSTDEEGDKENHSNNIKHKKYYKEILNNQCKNKTFNKFRILSIRLMSIDDDICIIKDNTKDNYNFQGVTERSENSISMKNKIEYNEFVIQAIKNEEQSNFEESLLHYIHALEICDSDVELHGKIAYLSEKLDLFNF